jgi:hypothetical protein
MRSLGKRQNACAWIVTEIGRSAAAIGTLLLLGLTLGISAPRESPAYRDSIQTDKSSDAEQEAQKRALWQKANDSSKSLESRKAFLEELLLLDPNHRLADRKLDEVNQEIEQQKREREAKAKAAEEQETAKRAESEKDAQSKAALDGAQTAFVSGNLGVALHSVIQSLQIRPGNVDALRLKDQIIGKIAQEKRNWLIKTGIVSVIVLGAGLGAFFSFRRRKMFLRVIEGQDAGAIFPLERAHLRVGASGEQSEIVLEDPENRISRIHFELVRSGRRCLLKDRSSNGTKLNGRPVVRGKSISLKSGDVVSLADVVTVEFCIGRWDR